MRVRAQTKNPGGPGPAAQAPSPPDRSPRQARGCRGWAAQPPATHQDAFEEVVLLWRQLHVRHRGWREGWVPARSVSRDGHRDKPRLRVELRVTGQFIGLDLGLGSLGRAVVQGWQWKRKPVWVGCPSAPALLWGKRRRLPQGARWQLGPTPTPSSEAACACAGRPAARNWEPVLGGRFCHLHPGPG